MEWLGGTYYMIGGLTKEKYSNNLVTKLINNLRLTTGKIRMYNINEDKVCHKSYISYTGNILEEDINNLGQCKLFINELESEFSLGGRKIPIKLINIINEDESISISVMFEFIHISEETDKISKKLKQSSIENLCNQFYSSGIFIYGSYGEEADIIQLSCIISNSEYSFDNLDSYFDKRLLNINRVKEITDINPYKFYSIFNGSSEGFLIQVFEYSDKINNMTSEERDTWSKYLLWLRRVENDLRNGEF